MTDVQHLFAGRVDGNNVYLTVLLDSLNNTTSFKSGDKISLGSIDQKIVINLIDGVDYTMDTLTFDKNVLKGGIDPGGKSAWLALKADPASKGTTNWAMTLTEAVPGQPAKTITIDPIIEEDPKKSGAPVIDKLNGVLPGS